MGSCSPAAAAAAPSVTLPVKAIRARMTVTSIRFSHMVMSSFRHRFTLGLWFWFCTFRSRMTTRARDSVLPTHASVEC
jgi:hypothetical protein